MENSMENVEKTEGKPYFPFFSSMEEGTMREKMQ